MSRISKSAQISKTVIIHENVVIEDNVCIKDYVVIYPGTTIKANCVIFDGAILGRVPLAVNSVARKLKKEYAPLIIGEGCVISPHCTIYTGTQIGNETLVGDNCSIREEVEIEARCIIGRNVTVDCDVKIGAGTKIMDLSHITGETVIEENVFISALVVTTNDNSMGRSEYSDEHIVGPYIKKNATIGAGANLLPNVVIGENSIVGAGSVVTRSVPDRKLAMGVPARVVRDVLASELKL